MYFALRTNALFVLLNNVHFFIPSEMTNITIAAHTVHGCMYIHLCVFTYQGCALL